MGYCGPAIVSWLKRGAFIASFFGARGLQFLAPVAVANLLSVGDYGVIEWAHAAATIFVAVATVGTNALIPYILLQSQARGNIYSVYLHQAILSAACVVAAVVFATVGRINSAVVFAALFAAALALQSMWTLRLRSFGATSASLFLEASLFVLIAAAAALGRLWSPPHGLMFIGTAMLFFHAVLFLAIAQELRIGLSTGAAKAHYGKTLKAGFPLMVGGMLTLLATTSGRLGIGLLGTNEQTGSFAAIARIAALPIVVHQIAVASAFRDLFSVPIDQLRHLLQKLTWFLIMAVIVFLLFLPFGGGFLGPAFHRAVVANPVAGVLLGAQVILWSGVASNDLVAARHNLLPRLLPWTTVALCTGLLVAGIILGWVGVTVDNFAAWHTGVMAVLFVSQSYLMARMGVRFGRYWGLCGAGFTGVALLFLLVLPMLMKFL
jgi:O-antigen/teichoic acid export membrane protein